MPTCKQGKGKDEKGVRADLAQSVERSAFNRVVVGSIPTVGATFSIFGLIWFL